MFVKRSCVLTTNSTAKTPSSDTGSLNRFRRDSAPRCGAVTTFPRSATRFGNPSYSAVVHYTQIINPRLLNEIAFNYNGNRINIYPSRCLCGAIWLRFQPRIHRPERTGPYSIDCARRQHRYQLSIELDSLEEQGRLLPIRRRLSLGPRALTS